MEKQQTEQLTYLNTRPGRKFLEQRNKFRQNVETAKRMQARLEAAVQQLDMLSHEFRATHLESLALLKAVECQLEVLNRSVLARRLAAPAENAGPFPFTAGCLAGHPI